MQDNKGKTALHVAAIKRYPKVARVLVEDERTSLLTLDDEDRTALHYAAEDGKQAIFNNVSESEA